MSKGLDCPVCGFKIQLTIDMLVKRDSIFCSSCGLKLTMDKEASKETINVLKEFDKEFKNIENKKNSIMNNYKTN
ncbi:MAG: hypothetical protein A2Y34_14585 [Spirochaetes bacterium GWC1_27_15]|nr:MAG: hypothetical protein A2Z98_00325 [Spirochaetes bacterium GWB1_27_13]OHD27886.1 MAG: hypothetical protein A2Y34_14585 [Spirochaetes bacterium GWC1_27_15]